MTSEPGAWQWRPDGVAPGNGMLWMLAAFVAFAAHAGAAWWLTRETPQEVAVAGAAELVIDVALLGSAPADQVSAGDVLQPVNAQETDPIEPVPESTPAVTAPVAQSIQPADEARKPVESRPLPPAPAQEQPPIDAPQPSRVQLASMPPVEPVGPIEPTAASVEEVKPIEPEETVALPETSLLPTRRPEPKVAETKRQPDKPEQVTERRPVRQRAGNSGRNEADVRKGQADGTDNAARASRKPGSGRDMGNAAVSNYPGKVATKLRRALRYPAKARRERLRGEVHVAFTVAGGGGVSGIRVVRSSGSDVLDGAALDAVRRAAPFPPIPDGRPSWSFTVPLAFTR